MFFFNFSLAFYDNPWSGSNLPEESKVLFTPRASQKSICQTKYKTFKYIFQYKLRLGHMYLTIPYLSLEAFVL